MFDFHVHSSLSFDGRTEPARLAIAAREKGIKELCFTDHMDFDPMDPDAKLHFTMEEFHRTFDSLQVPGIAIRLGVEFGMLPDNREQMDSFIKGYPFDYVIGSAHFANGYDPYYDGYWEGKTLQQAELGYLEEILACVRAQEEFDVLGHLTYITKTRPNPEKRPVPYDLYREVIDEILKILVAGGKGLEVNTSGMDCSGQFLPPAEYLHRFKELGGRIVTVGSDAHNTARIGQYCREACQMVQDIFGYVCTFERRTPVFHRV